MGKKVALHNLGCKVNAYEVEAMQQLLRCISYHRRRDFEAVKLKDDDLAYLVYFADTIAFGAEKTERRQDDKFDASLCLESLFNYFSDHDTYKRYFLLKEINTGKEINYAVRDLSLIHI